MGGCAAGRAASHNRPTPVQNASEPATTMVAAMGRAHELAAAEFDFEALVVGAIVHLHKDFFEVEIVD